MPTYFPSHHHGTFPKTGTSGIDNIGTCYDSSSESCRNVHSGHIPVSFARSAGKSPERETTEPVQQLISNSTKLSLLTFVILLSYFAVMQTLHLPCNLRRHARHSESQRPCPHRPYTPRWSQTLCCLLGQDAAVLTARVTRYGTGLHENKTNKKTWILRLKNYLSSKRVMLQVRILVLPV